MSSMNRREFLTLSAAGAVSLATTGTAFAADKPAFRMGAQSYSFRAFPLAEAVNKANELGIKYLELFSGHIKIDAGDAEFAAKKALLEKAGIKALSAGVEGFSGKDEAGARKKFEFAKALGLENISADPQPDAFDMLDKLTEEYKINIAIHNHGPQDERYGHVEKLLKAIKDHSKRIGACVDTGHSIRSGEKPHEVIHALGDRVYELHLKDWITGGDEKRLGEGQLDLVAVAKELKALNFKGGLFAEYELDEKDPVPGMKVGMENWRKAVVQVYGASW